MVTPDELDKARKYADAVGVELVDALVQQKVADAEAVVGAHAEAQGVAYVDLAEMQLDGQLIVSLPAVLCRKHSIVPLMNDDHFVVASPRLLGPDLEDDLRMRFNKPVRAALCTSASINDVINRHYTRETAEAEMRTGRHLTMGTTNVQKATGGNLSPEEEQAKAQEKQKTQLVATIAAGAMAMMGSQLILGQPLLVALVIGVVVAGIVFGVMKAVG